MRKAKRVIGYVCDIPIPGTSEVIGKNDQRARILKYAQKENLEVVCIYEDEQFTADFMARPGVQRVLNCNEHHDQVLVERVWCFTRNRKEIDPMLAALDRKGVQLMATSYLWDCLSQQVRHCYMGTVAEKARDLMKTQNAAKDGKAA